MSHIAAIGLGGNVGNVVENFLLAICRLNSLEDTQVLQISQLYQTGAMGAAAGGRFVNAVALVATRAAPEQLLTSLQSIEVSAGRRPGVRWGPRPLDLDLLSHGDQVLHTPHLTVPHPGCWSRRFVLDPWCDVAPDWRHPELGETVLEMQARLLARPLRVAVWSEGETAKEEHLRAKLSDCFAPREVVVAKSHDEAADADIRFRLTGDTTARERTLSLAGDPHPVLLAAEIVKAALDEAEPGSWPGTRRGCGGD